MAWIGWDVKLSGHDTGAWSSAQACTLVKSMARNLTRVRWNVMWAQKSTRGWIGAGSYWATITMVVGWSVSQQTAFGHTGHTDWHHHIGWSGNQRSEQSKFIDQSILWLNSFINMWNLQPKVCNFYEQPITGMDCSKRGHKCGLYVSLRAGTQLADVTKTHWRLFTAHCLNPGAVTCWLTQLLYNMHAPHPEYQSQSNSLWNAKCAAVAKGGCKNP